MADAQEERRKKSLKAAIDDALEVYSYFLRKHPVLTKSLTSSFAAGLGQIISQKLTSRGKAQPIDFRPVVAFSTFGFVVTGPLLHYLYEYMDLWIPKTAPYAKIKRVALDRLVFMPPFLFLLFYLVTLLEGKSHAEAMKKIRETYWTALKMNWKVWTLVQYINLSYVPVKYRVLVGNTVAVFWNVYLAHKRASLK